MDPNEAKIVKVRTARRSQNVVPSYHTLQLIKDNNILPQGVVMTRPKDIVPIGSISSHKFAPNKIEINQSTQTIPLPDNSEHEYAGGVFAARLDENYINNLRPLQGPLTLLPYQVRLTLREVNRVKINLKIPETISEEFEIEEPYRVINNRIMQPRAKKNLKIPETISEEVEIEESDSVNDDQMPKTSCCVLSCSCLKKLIPRKSAKIAITNQNLSVSLAIATDLSEVQTNREKDDNDREKEVTV